MSDRNRKMRVKLTSDRAIYIHNDLSNTAFYFKNRVTTRLEEGDHDGIFLEMIAGLTMTAFAMEASINFVGDKVLREDWNERAAYWKKVKQVFEALGIKPDFETRPFSSIGKMQALRDALAHGKPERITKEEIVVGTYDELEARQRLHGTWEEMVTIDNVKDWFDDMRAIWELMLEAGDIEVFDTMSQGMHGMEFIEHVNE